MELNILMNAQAERIATGLLTNDSIIVGAMREYGISNVATSDKAFDSVAGVTVFAPTDV
jgi:predicted nucleic acid-binding protein